MPSLGIGYNIFHFFLSIISSVRNTVPTCHFLIVITDAGLSPVCSYFHQFRIFLYLDPPSMIFRQMPMVNIQFVFGQQINLSFDKFYRKNMISDLLHNTPVNETRSIVYLSTRYLHFSLSGSYRTHLHQRLQTVKPPCFLPPYFYTGRSYQKMVSFCPHLLGSGRLKTNCLLVFLFGTVCNRQIQTEIPA